LFRHQPHDPTRDAPLAAGLIEVSFRKDGLWVKVYIADRCFWSYDNEYLSLSP
jgi:hypothetical protein